MGSLYAVKKCVKRFRSSNDETAAALELSNIEVAQEESVLESAKKSARPKVSQGETSSKKKVAVEEQVSELLWNVRLIWCW